MPDLITKPYYKYYNANACSTTTFVFLCVVVLMIICPIYIVLYSGSNLLYKFNKFRCME